ncbi:spermatogenesis-associated protein 4-like isoform X1 [Argonauta hians]
MAEFPREVILWIQGLELSSKIVIPKRDLANGYLIAEIFNRYYPFEVDMTYFSTGISLYARRHNWYQLSKFFKKKKIDISQACIDGTIFFKERFTLQMMQTIYKLLTDKKWSYSISPTNCDFDLCDFEYQSKLPMYAQSTATRAIKTNLVLSEMIVYPNQLLNAKKAQKIIDRHMELRLKKREENPERFNVQPTLGQQSIRQQTAAQFKEEPEKTSPKRTFTCSFQDLSVRFNDIKLKQPFIHKQAAE